VPRDLTPQPDPEREALDAYSATLVSVAESLRPSVASVQPLSDSGRVLGSGSGVVLAADGYLLTSAHVVGGARGGRVGFADGRDGSFQVVGADPLSDLAVLRTGLDQLPAARLGDASTLRVGQLVVAVGDPLGLTGSVTAGVVSALGRSIPTRARDHVRVIDDVIQTDAALNPGNSGGALADSRARVVGINTALAGVGLGLAVPLNATTQQIVASLLRDGRVQRAHLGIAGAARPLPPRWRDTLQRQNGLEVASVVPASPAEAAGIRGGDIVVEVDGRPVESPRDVQRILVSSAVDRFVVLRVIRGSQLRTLTAIPEELKAA
jgi:S1-C subfamily serine protease